MNISLTHEDFKTLVNGDVVKGVHPGAGAATIPVNIGLQDISFDVMLGELMAAKIAILGKEESGLLIKGKPAESLTRDQLIESLAIMTRLYGNCLDEKSELIDKIYNPKG